jgi:hypothetical protein
VLPPPALWQVAAIGMTAGAALFAADMVGGMVLFRPEPEPASVDAYAALAG